MERLADKPVGWKCHILNDLYFINNIAVGHFNSLIVVFTDCCFLPIHLFSGEHFVISNGEMEVSCANEQ